MKKRLGFNIVFLGMVASGKDTQAEILGKKYNLHFVESGKYWRKLEKEKSKDGEMLRKTTSLGLPAPVVLMKKFIVNNLAKAPKNKDILFLGNPRLKPEAQLLNKLLKEKKQKYIAIYITLPDKEVIKRSTKRMRNADDAKYIKRRISWQKIQVGKTVKYFESLGLMTKINGNKPVSIVTMQIEKVLARYQASLSNSQGGQRPGRK